MVNSFIAWRNHVLSGRPSKERSYKKYGIREARLNLITRWAKRCSRHYKRTQPHRQKRVRMVHNFMVRTKRNILCTWAQGDSSQARGITSRQTVALASRVGRLCHLQAENKILLLGLYVNTWRGHSRVSSVWAPRMQRWVAQHAKPDLNIWMHHRYRSAKKKTQKWSFDIFFRSVITQQYKIRKDFFSSPLYPPLSGKT